MKLKTKYRPRCFFDIQLDGNAAGRIVFELFSDVCPLTVENFRALCTGEKGDGKLTGKPLHYKGSGFHRVVKDFMIQGGDFTAGNGTGGESIYGGTFKDESLDLKHDKQFLLSMANRGKDTNGSQFFVTTQAVPHLDGVHVVFGHVISGQDVVSQIEKLPVDNGKKPLTEVIISNCGELVPMLKPKNKPEKEKSKKKKRKSEDHQSSSDSEGEDEEGGKKKKKKEKKRKKKSKKHKKEKRTKKESGEIVEKEDEAEGVSTVRAEEIPDVPANKFLMRQTSPEQRLPGDVNRLRNDDRVQRRANVSRSGRKIRGRGFMQFRTPSRSRSRSRSVTPPHWRQAQARMVPLSEYERRMREQHKLDEERKRLEEEEEKEKEAKVKKLQDKKK